MGRSALKPVIARLNETINRVLQLEIAVQKDVAMSFVAKTVQRLNQMRALKARVQ